jgi:hypothetical protein
MTNSGYNKALEKKRVPRSVLTKRKMSKLQSLQGPTITELLINLRARANTLHNTAGTLEEEIKSVALRVAANLAPINRGVWAKQLNEAIAQAGIDASNNTQLEDRVSEMIRKSAARKAERLIRDLQRTANQPGAHDSPLLSGSPSITSWHGSSVPYECRILRTC